MSPQMPPPHFNMSNSMIGSWIASSIGFWVGFQIGSWMRSLIGSWSVTRIGSWMGLNLGWDRIRFAQPKLILSVK